MPDKDPRIDAYIEKSADFAKPIMTHLRKVIHKASPKITDNIKWSMPAFEYKGLVCGFAAFKQHCTFGFWKQSLLEQGAFSDVKTAMGSFGRLTSKKDLPPDEMLIKLIRQAVEGMPAGPLREAPLTIESSSRNYYNSKRQCSPPQCSRST